MKKHFKFLSLVMCLAMAASVAACSFVTDTPNSESASESASETVNPVEKLATVTKATADELAAINGAGIVTMDTNETIFVESAYTFTATETVEEAAANEYANWYADYYVTLDRAISENQFGLAGSYELYQNGAWIAFYAPATEANVATALLSSVSDSPWTYADIVSGVSVFKCGVFDNNNACAGMTIKVELRLTNPADETEQLVVNQTSYTFAE